MTLRAITFFEIRSDSSAFSACTMSNGNDRPFPVPPWMHQPSWAHFSSLCPPTNHEPIYTKHLDMLSFLIAQETADGTSVGSQPG